MSRRDETDDDEDDGDDPLENDEGERWNGNIRRLVQLKSSLKSDEQKNSLH